MPTVVNQISGNGQNANYTGSLTTFTEGSDVLVYDIYSAQGNNVRTIKYENSKWVDANPNDWPVLYDSTFTNVITETAVDPQYIYYSWYGTNDTLTNPYYPIAGSGGSGGGTSTEGSSYSATLEVNSNGWLEYTIPTTSSAGTYYLLKTSDGGSSWAQHGQTITHGVLETQGSFVFDQTLIWIIRSPTEDELARWSPSTNKKVFCNFW